MWQTPSNTGVARTAEPKESRLGIHGRNGRFSKRVKVGNPILVFFKKKNSNHGRDGSVDIDPVGKSKMGEEEGEKSSR